MLLSFLAAAVCGVVLMQTGVGRQALVDQWERTALAFGREVPDERYAALVAMSEYGSAYALISAAVSVPVLSCAVAAIIFIVFTGFAAGSATFTQVLAIVAHGSVLLALRQVVAAPFNYARETLASPTTLGQLFPVFDEMSPAARFLGAVDLFLVWWVIVLAIGTAVLYRRSARSTASAFVGAYLGFAALLAISIAVAGGTL